MKALLIALTLLILAVVIGLITARAVFDGGDMLAFCLAAPLFVFGLGLALASEDTP